MHSIATAIILSILLVNDEVEAKDAYHSTFTRYETAKELWSNHRTSFSITGCQPAQFIMYCRHGSRYPGKKAMAKMKLHLPKIKQNILNNILIPQKIRSQINYWSLQYNDSNHHVLATSGEKELENLGRRFSRAFPHLLGAPFTSSQEYRHTNKQRTKLSAEMFANGALGSQEFKNFKAVPPLSKDPLLRFYKSCEKWRKNVDKSKAAHEEEQRYLNSKRYLNMMKKISRKIFKGRKILNHDQIKAIYSACTFDYLLNSNHSSPWCSILSTMDLQTLEYWEDVEHFWTDGYAYPITYEQACPPVADIVTNFQNFINNQPYKRAVLHFSHLGLILKIFARFGLFNDKVNLTSDMMNHNNFVNFDVHQRQYRMSKIGSMASNIAFVLYQCGHSFKVKVYVQEHEVIIPGCKYAACDVRRFLSLFENIAKSCDVEQICKI